MADSSFTEKDATLNREVSIALDFVRFAAAFVVFAGHLSGARFTGGFMWQAGSYTGMAVAVFFVLSGFVIGHITQFREISARDYAISRLARVYSVAFPAVMITVVLDALGRLLAPTLYNSDWGFSPEQPLLQVITALTFTQKAFGFNFSLGSDLPYWSLNYEVAYYVVFGIAAFARRGFAKFVACGAILACTGLPTAAMFPLWLAGVAVARLAPWQKLSRNVGRAWVVAAVAGFFASEIWAASNGRWLAGIGPVFRPELAQDYLIAVLFLVGITGGAACSTDFVQPAALVARPIRWLAGRTFSLYLYHLPVAQFLSALNPYPPAHAVSRMMIIGGTLTVVFVLAEFTEQRKKVWKSWFEALLKPRNTSPAR